MENQNIYLTPISTISHPNDIYQNVSGQVAKSENKSKNIWKIVAAISISISLALGTAGILLAWKLHADTSGALENELETLNLKLEGEVKMINNPAKSSTTWYKPGNGYEYKVFPMKFNYTKAKEVCLYWEAKIAVNGLKNKTISKNLYRRFGGNLFIGLNDIQTENKFMWEDGTPLLTSQALWRNYEPNDRYSIEDCVEVTEVGGLWNDMPCYTKLHPLCERPNYSG